MQLKKSCWLSTCCEHQEHSQLKGGCRAHPAQEKLALLPPL
uniref:Uncharacterized protein n=1 Tax=Anguilla anguilla TaxID=7936 RepID=A0A0E9SJD3_ANGAN